MKVKIVDRKIYLPKDLADKADIPNRGICEAEVVGDEIRIRKQTSKDLNILKMLEEPPPQQGIDEMMEAEEVEDV